MAVQDLKAPVPCQSAAPHSQRAHNGNEALAASTHQGPVDWRLARDAAVGPEAYQDNPGNCPHGPLPGWPAKLWGAVPTGAVDVGVKFALGAVGLVGMYVGGRWVLRNVQSNALSPVSRQPISDLVISGPKNGAARSAMQTLLYDGTQLEQCFRLLDVARIALRFDILALGLKSTNFAVRATAAEHLIAIWVEKQEARAAQLLRGFQHWLAESQVTHHPEVQHLLGTVRNAISERRP